MKYLAIIFGIGSACLPWLFLPTRATITEQLLIVIAFQLSILVGLAVTTFIVALPLAGESKLQRTLKRESEEEAEQASCGN